MFAPRYFAGRYFAGRYFADRAGVLAQGRYFAPRFFAPRYFAPRYFPGLGQGVLPPEEAVPGNQRWSAHEPGTLWRGPHAPRRFADREDPGRRFRGQQRRALP